MTRHVTRMTLAEASFYTPEQKAEIAAQYPEHERDARLDGVPQLGSGRIFPLAEGAVTVAAFKLPAHWPVLGAIDFGWEHPTAAVKLAHDRDGDVVYVTHGYRVRRATPVIHAAALKAWGAGLPFAWPHDGYQHDKQSGKPTAEAYREQGLAMLPEHARFPDLSTGVEAGLMAMLDRMQTGRLKVFGHLREWLDEFRLYHRKDGVVVKVHDDLMCATRYGIMCLRFAAPRGGRWKRAIVYPANYMSIA